MPNPKELRGRARNEAERCRRAVGLSRALRPKVEATLARARVLHARIASQRLIARVKP